MTSINASGDASQGNFVKKRKLVINYIPCRKLVTEYILSKVSSYNVVVMIICLAQDVIFNCHAVTLMSYVRTYAVPWSV